MPDDMLMGKIYVRLADSMQKQVVLIKLTLDYFN